MMKYFRKDSLTRHNKKMHKELGIPQVQVKFKCLFNKFLLDGYKKSPMAQVSQSFYSVGWFYYIWRAISLKIVVFPLPKS